LICFESFFNEGKVCLGVVNEYFESTLSVGVNDGPIKFEQKIDLQR